MVLKLADAAVMRTAHNGFIYIYIPVPDLQVKAAIGVGTNPGFIMNSCPLITKIRQGYQISCITFLTFGETEVFHYALLPTENLVLYSIQQAKDIDKIYSRLTELIRL